MSSSTGIARAPCLALGIACLAAAPAVAQGPSEAGGAGPEAEVTHVTAPILLDAETLFRVRGTFAYPEARARDISDRIVRDRARTPSIAPEAVQAVPADEFVNITAGDHFLLTVTEADARVSWTAACSQGRTSGESRAASEAISRPASLGCC